MPRGPRAALESFYYAFNHRDLEVLTAVWSHHPLAQLKTLYGTVFTSRLDARVGLGEIVEYLGPGYAVFASREDLTYRATDGKVVGLAIRTSRFFHYDHQSGRWAQTHHHGSVDDPAALSAYRAAVR